MSDALYQLGVEEWRRAWHWLSPESQACPPDLCTVQVYDVTDRANSARQHGDLLNLQGSRGQQIETPMPSQPPLGGRAGKNFTGSMRIFLG